LAETGYCEFAPIEALIGACGSASKPQIGRFWAHRGEDGIMREKQLLIDFLSAGGPMYYRGRDMLLTHRGMRISESDWNVFLGHAAATLAKFQVPEAEQRDVVAFVQSLKKECVEC
jgi:hemoglobin